MAGEEDSDVIVIEELSSPPIKKKKNKKTKKRSKTPNQSLRKAPALSTPTKTPPPTTSEYSPLPAEIEAQIQALWDSPGFEERRHNSVATVLENAKKKAAKHPRCKLSRQLMTGFECRCCKGYYDSLGLEGDKRKEYVDRVSKHRAWEKMPETPPGYWDLEIPDAEEQIRRGWLIDTDSPLIKKNKPKKKLNLSPLFKRNLNDALSKKQPSEKPPPSSIDTDSPLIKTEIKIYFINIQH